MLVTMNRYTRFYVNQSWGGEIDPVNKVIFRMQRGNVIGSFFGWLFIYVKPLLYSGEKGGRKRGTQNVSNIITDIYENRRARRSYF